MRLAKYLAHAGVASRRASETIIADGRVTVDGEVVTDPARDVDDRADRQGRRQARADRRASARRLPASTSRRASSRRRRTRTGRRTVVALVPSRERLYPVGRLDFDTTGLILLTNDGDLAHRLTHPSFEVPRTYRARVANAPGPRARAARAARGRRARGRHDRAREGPPDLASGHLELTIHEGRKRQVKRMLEAVGHRVYALERVALRAAAARARCEPRRATAR